MQLEATETNTIQSLLFIVFLLDKLHCYIMIYFGLFLIAILTVASAGAAPIYCSDVQSPASGSYNTDLSQVIPLQYCIIDNCTIMKIDTGEQLNIVYTTESLLMVTPINGLTSMVIAKIDDALPCLKYHSRTDNSQLIENAVKIVVALLVMILSSYILIAHFLFKELYTLFGKLLILYNLCVLSTGSSFIALLLMHHWIIVNSQTICHTAMICHMLSTTGIEVFAMTILAHLVYVMRCCYNLKSEITSRNEKFIFRCYIAYALSTLVLLFFLIIVYDWRTENGRHVLLPGHCNFFDQYSYDTLHINNAIAIANKVAQITMFIAYLVYFCKFKAEFRDALNSVKYN